MSQTNNFPSINQASSSISSNALCNSNDIQDDLTVVNNHDGWANFDAFANPNSETIPETISTADDWASFESSAEHSNDKQLEKINKDDDVFGDYSEVHISQIASSPIDTLTTEQIKSLISTCFPLEPSTLSTNSDEFIPFELPSLTTFKDPIKQLPCFKHSLSLWNVLSTISNDPIGIQYQWRKSNSERLFHQALGVQERFRPKTILLTSETSQSDVPTMISDVNNENKISPQTIDPNFDWKQSGLENPLTDIDSSSLSSSSIKIETDELDVNKTLDLDYYVPPIEISTLNKEEPTTSSTTIYRNNSPILQQHSTPIKTIHLFPGSSTVLHEDVKTVIDSVPNFSFINPKALMFAAQLNPESTSLY